MSDITLYKKNPRRYPCVTLIGMAAAGKSTIGKLLAETLEWAFIDSDHLIESLYARRLEDVAKAFGREEFLDIEGRMICDMDASRAIIATGGSVVYRDYAIRHLAELGPIVYINTPLERIEERIAENPERGLITEPGETLADLYRKRARLYENAANIVCQAGECSPEECVARIKDKLARLPEFRDLTEA